VVEATKCNTFAQPDPLIFTFVTTLLVLLYIAMEYFDFDNFWDLILKENTCKIYLGVQMGYV
jgi:hypothetical protein